MKDRYLIFTLLLCATEVYQYFAIERTHFIHSDFSTYLSNVNVLLPALLLSIAGWIGVYFFEKITRGKGRPRLVIPENNWVLSIFVINLLITVFADVGHVMRVSTSSLSILTTLIPIHYLILVMASQKVGMRFFIAGALYGSIDLYRTLLGGVFKLFYIFVVKFKRLALISILCFPIGYWGVSELINYKYKIRKIVPQPGQSMVFNSVTNRIASTPNFAFGLDSGDGLAYFCHQEPYVSQYLAAAMSVIPKRMFGIEFVKTYNNCLIEYRLGQLVSDSSVNSPFLLNVILLARYDYLLLLSYLVLVGMIMTFITVAANFLFGEQSSLLRYWIYFEFVWTGNMLMAMIPAYFLFVLLIYYRLKKPIALYAGDSVAASN